MKKEDLEARKSNGQQKIYPLTCKVVQSENQAQATLTDSLTEKMQLEKQLEETQRIAEANGT